MPLADREVGRVMCGGDLDGTGAEIRQYLVIGHDRDTAAEDRQNRLAAHQIGVARVVRVDGDRGVAEKRLGPCGGHGDRAAFGRIAGAGRQGIADVAKAAGAVFVLHLQVGDGGFAARTDVDHPRAAVEQPFVPQPHEDLAHGA